MPQGSPGMETSTPQPYETLLVGLDGSAAVFARHWRQSWWASASRAQCRPTYEPRWPQLALWLVPELTGRSNDDSATTMCGSKWPNVW